MAVSRLTRSLIALAAVGALALAGCSGSDSPGDAASSGVAGSASASDTASPTKSASPTESSTAAGAEEVAPTAIATAVASVAGSRAFAYARDDRDRYIEVTVIADSVETVVILDITGTSITGTENEGRLDSSDLADFNAATVEMVDAISTALARAPGVLHDADLDDPNGTLVWKIEIRGGASTTTVLVDAKSGTITS